MIANERHGLVLERLLDKTGALTVMLISKEGYGIAEAGDTSYLNTTALAALVAGMFSATREVAGLVGEKQFSILLQQGESRHIHIGLIGERVMMVVVFQDIHRIGKVRMAAQEAADSLSGELAEEMTDSASEAAVSAPEFREYALDLVDRVFRGK